MLLLPCLYRDGEDLGVEAGSSVCCLGVAESAAREQQCGGCGCDK